MKPQITVFKAHLACHQYSTSAQYLHLSTSAGFLQIYVFVTQLQTARALFRIFFFKLRYQPIHSLGATISNLLLHFGDWVFSRAAPLPWPHTGGDFNAVCRRVATSLSLDVACSQLVGVANMDHGGGC